MMQTMGRPNPAATLAAGVSRLARPPQLQQTGPASGGDNNYGMPGAPPPQMGPAMPMFRPQQNVGISPQYQAPMGQEQPQAMPQQMQPFLAPPMPRYGGLVSGQGRGLATFPTHDIRSVLQQITQNTRNPQTSNLSALYQRFLGNQGVR